MGLHADVLRCVGRLDEAEEWAQNALSLAEAKEQHYFEAELHLTLGEISLGREEPDAAEAARRFERALEIARSQHARFYELRAATSLARLLRDQGRPDEARALLQPVYDWFTEGFDTAPLKEARALLHDLA
jgi:predicted ATPase